MEPQALRALDIELDMCSQHKMLSNKCQIDCQESMLLEEDIDICAITEIGITSEEETCIQARLVTAGYIMKCTPRPKHHGGHIALIGKKKKKKKLEIMANMHTFRSMECISYKLKLLYRSLYFNVLYRKK